MSESVNNKPPENAASTAKQKLVDALYRRYREELCHYVRARYGSGPPEPEDVAQAAFTKFASLEQPEQIDNPRAFLYRVANNVVTDEYRRKATREKFLAEEVRLEDINKSAESEPESVLMLNEMNLSLEAALLDLDNRERDFLLLHRVQKLSYTEIAQQSGMSRNGVKAVIVKALGKCEKSIRKTSISQPETGHMGSSAKHAQRHSVDNTTTRQGKT